MGAVENSLAPIAKTLDALPDSTVGEVVVGSTLIVSGEVLAKK
jgi:hypothetical protein